MFSHGNHGNFYDGNTQNYYVTFVQTALLQPATGGSILMCIVGYTNVKCVKLVQDTCNSVMITGLWKIAFVSI